MTLKQLIDRITFYTSLDENIFQATDRLIAINNAYDKLHSIILDSQDEWDFDDSNNTELPIATTDLLANQDIYAIPDTLYRLNKVEINYGAGFIKALPLDLNENFLSEDELLQRSNVSTPYYRIFGQTIQFYPKPTAEVSNGLKLYYDRAITHFTSDEYTAGTVKPGLDQLWHDYIALQASLDGAVKYNLVNKGDLSNLLQEMEQRIRKYYGKKTTDRKLKLTNFIEDYE
jgi:hypothetical protein